MTKVVEKKISINNVSTIVAPPALISGSLQIDPNNLTGTFSSNTRDITVINRNDSNTSGDVNRFSEFVTRGAESSKR